MTFSLGGGGNIDAVTDGAGIATASLPVNSPPGTPP